MNNDIRRDAETLRINILDDITATRDVLEAALILRQLEFYFVQQGIWCPVCNVHTPYHQNDCAVSHAYSTLDEYLGPEEDDDE